MSELRISRLGFGLSGIAGSGNFIHQQRLVRTAIDAGITHFDVAPFYGSGDAEKILGDILRDCPEQVTVTTKFGLLPAKVPGKLRAIVRPVLRRVKGLKQLAVKLINYSHRPDIQCFKPGDLLASAEASMRKLQRPANIFLLHDMVRVHSESEAVVGELHQLKKTGYAALTGISGSEADLRELCLAHPAVYSVTQLENSLSNPADLGFFKSSGISSITHRAIMGGFEHLNFLFRFRPGFGQIWEREIGLDVSNQDVLMQVILELALFENQAGTVLFSSTRPERIKIAAAAVQKPLLTEVQCEGIRRLFQDVYQHPPDRRH
jgi:aryl-alcohol dehydrogenase-like predicted oxidoreductase